jgi:hypothetical protein
LRRQEQVEKGKARREKQRRRIHNGG